MAQLPKIAAIAVALSACSTAPRSFEPPKAAVSHLDHEPFTSLLHRYVSAKGGVDYDRWHNAPHDVAALDAHLGQLAHSSPQAAPHLFTATGAVLSYWINLYNAIVIREVLRRWPLESVRDVSPTLTGKIVRGKGFFRDLKFVVNRRALSLDDIEHEILRRRFDDARIHFALNCASASCPVLQRGSFEPGDLDRQLESATRTFINDRRNVSVDHGDKTIRLSKLFDWYDADFSAHATSRGIGDTTIAFVAHYASKRLAPELERARQRGYRVRFEGYNWAVNSQRSRSPKGPVRAPPVEFAELGTTKTFRTGDATKTIVVDFWATWCRPCRESLPKLAAIAASRPDLIVIAVSIDADDQRVTDFLDTLALPNPLRVGRDPKQEAMSALGVSSVPTLLLLEGGTRRELRSVEEIPPPSPP